jgi:hypothetical protein
MFHASTQRSNWIHKDTNEINGKRQKANYNYVSKRDENVIDFLLFVKYLK